MNVKNRILRLEKQTGTANEFCNCPTVSGTEIYLAAAGGTPKLISSAVPAICSTCGKPAQREQIIIQGVESDIQPPLAA